MLNSISDTYFPDENRTDVAVKDSFLTTETENQLNPTFKIAWGNQDEHNTIAFTLKSITDSAFLFKCAEKKEELLIVALKNFLRKANLSELNDELNFGDITEEQYYSKINENPNKYEININKLHSEDDAFLIYELVNKIGFDIRDFSVSDVSEMFSVEEQQLICSIKSLSPTLRINGDIR